jgi:hypothetical protein
MNSNVSTASFSACWLGIRRIPARGVAGARGPAPRSLLFFLCVDPRKEGGACEVLDLRLLPASKSAAGASPSPTFAPVMDIRLAAAFIAGLVVDRQYA